MPKGLSNEELVAGFMRVAAGEISLPQLANELGVSRKLVNSRISRLRKIGVNLPFVSRSYQRTDIASLNKLVKETHAATQEAPTTQEIQAIK